MVGSFIKRYFRYIFYFLLAANLLVINKLMEHREMLLNTYSPKGIINLEFNFSQARQDSILKTWDNTRKSFIILGTECSETNKQLTGTDVARIQNNWDLLFVVLYTMLLLGCCLRLFPFRGGSLRLSLVIVIILSAGLLNFIEDFYYFSALHNHSIPAWPIWLSASYKIYTPYNPQHLLLSSDEITRHAEEWITGYIRFFDQDPYPDMEFPDCVYRVADSFSGFMGNGSGQGSFTDHQQPQIGTGFVFDDAQCFSSS